MNKAYHKYSVLSPNCENQTLLSESVNLKSNRDIISKFKQFWINKVGSLIGTTQKQKIIKTTQKICRYIGTLKHLNLHKIKTASIRKHNIKNKDRTKNCGNDLLIQNAENINQQMIYDNNLYSIYSMPTYTVSNNINEIKIILQYSQSNSDIVPNKYIKTNSK